MATQGPRFNFFQAQPGPDPSRQYSDWQGAIQAQNEAVNTPLRMLLQGLIESNLQDKRIHAAKAEHEKTLAYEKSRDATRDSQFNQELALRQGAESRQNAKDDYSKAQDQASLQLLLSSMMPGNSVEQISPQAQALQKSLGPNSMAQLFPLSQPVAPHLQAVDTFMQTQERRQEKQSVQAKLDADQQGMFDYANAGIDAGYITKPNIPLARALLHRNDPQAREQLHGMIEQGRKDNQDVTARKAQVKELTDYWDEHPGDPGAAQAAKGRHLLESMSKTSAYPTLWDSLYQHAHETTFGKPGAGATKEQKINFPGVGDVTLNTSLGRPGEYQIDAQGKPILPADADAELTALAEHAVPRAVTEAGVEINAGERDAKVQARKMQFLQIAGWREKGSSSPIGAMDPFSAQVGGAPAAAPSAAPAQQQAAPQQQAQAQAQDPLAGLPQDVLDAAHAARAGGPDAVRKVLQDATARAHQESLKPEANGAVGAEFLKKDPEPQWWWSYNSGYAPKLKQYGGSVEKARAAWAERWKKEFGR